MVDESNNPGHIVGLLNPSGKFELCTLIETYALHGTSKLLFCP